MVSSSAGIDACNANLLLFCFGQKFAPLKVLFLRLFAASSFVIYDILVEVWVKAHAAYTSEGPKF